MGTDTSTHDFLDFDEKEVSAKCVADTTIISDSDTISENEMLMLLRGLKTRLSWKKKKT